MNNTLQLAIWTIRPSTLLLDLIVREGHIEAARLAKSSSFNGLSVVFYRLSTEQFVMLQATASRLGLRNEEDRSESSYQTRRYPVGLNERAEGEQDAEIDIWHLRTLDYPHNYVLITKDAARSVTEHSFYQAFLHKVSRVEEARLRGERIDYYEGYRERLKKMSEMNLDH